MKMKKFHSDMTDNN